jgi:2,4-dienoyl-CoA reductase (NADPH2)
MSNYDGTVTDVWKNFEKRFAVGGVSGIVSTTFHVNADRLSPLQYPSIASDKHIPHLKNYIADIKRVDKGCNYIVQIGDPGYTTYTSLFPEDVDSKSSSAGFDLGFGYNNRRTQMSIQEIDQAIRDHIDGAERAQKAGADGVEITATKGYLIHQFLNPGINRRQDDWGGSIEKRFSFLKQIVTEVRRRVGKDYLLGIRLSASDLNYSPIALSLFRWPSPLVSKEGRLGNQQDTMLWYANELRGLGVDYLHVVNGFALR